MLRMIRLSSLGVLAFCFQIAAASYLVEFHGKWYEKRIQLKAHGETVSIYGGRVGKVASAVDLVVKNGDQAAHNLKLVDLIERGYASAFAKNMQSGELVLIPYPVTTEIPSFRDFQYWGFQVGEFVSFNRSTDTVVVKSYREGSKPIRLPTEVFFALQTKRSQRGLEFLGDFFRRKGEGFVMMNDNHRWTDSQSGRDAERNPDKEQGYVLFPKALPEMDQDSTWNLYRDQVYYDGLKALIRHPEWGDQVIIKPESEGIPGFVKGEAYIGQLGFQYVYGLFNIKFSGNSILVMRPNATRYMWVHERLHFNDSIGTLLTDFGSFMEARKGVSVGSISYLRMRSILLEWRGFGIEAQKMADDFLAGNLYLANPSQDPKQYILSRMGRLKGVFAERFLAELSPDEAEHLLAFLRTDQGRKWEPSYPSFDIREMLTIRASGGARLDFADQTEIRGSRTGVCAALSSN